MTVQDYLRGLSKVVSSLVGYQLSTVNKEPVPSVYVARQQPPKPSYPYASCDYIGKGNYGSRAVFEGFNDDCTEYATCYNRRLRLRVDFYGQYGDNILDTAEELGMRIRSPRGLDLIDEYMQGAGFISVSEPSYNSQLLSTEFEEFSAVTIDFWIISEITDTEFYTLDSANVSGELYTDFDQESPPLTIKSLTEND